MSDEFEVFPKIARLSREIIVTEKIDGTNAQVHVTDDGRVLAGSKSCYITPERDNFGFAAWVRDHAGELLALGAGRHYGEWWGSGIQRGYGLQKGEKRFSLFNTKRWSTERPECCGIVPILYEGPFDTAAIDAVLADLVTNGSRVVAGFTRPEGVVVYHPASRYLFKKTIEKDEEPKSRVA